MPSQENQIGRRSRAEQYQPGFTESTQQQDKILAKAKSTAGEAYDAVADKATSAVEEKKAGLSGGLTSVAQSIRTAGETMGQTEEQNFVTEYSARYARSAAEKLEAAAEYFETNDLKKIGRDAEDFARRNPAVFLGGAFVVGVLAARFFKSEPPRSPAP